MLFLPASIIKFAILASPLQHLRQLFGSLFMDNVCAIDNFNRAALGIHCLFLIPRWTRHSTGRRTGESLKGRLYVTPTVERTEHLSFVPVQIMTFLPVPAFNRAPKISATRYTYIPKCEPVYLFSTHPPCLMITC